MPTYHSYISCLYDCMVEFQAPVIYPCNKFMIVCYALSARASYLLIVSDVISKEK